MTRLFVAVWPPAHVVDALAGLVPARPGLRPVPPHQLHVTLRFLGDADAGEVVARLDGVALAAATAVLGPAIRRLGPSAVVVPVSGLDALAAAVRDATGDLGEPAGPFRGHLTLARLRRGTRRDDLVGRPVGGSFDVDEVLLVDSTLGQHGPDYAVVGRWPAHCTNRIASSFVLEVMSTHARRCPPSPSSASPCSPPVAATTTPRPTPRPHRRPRRPRRPPHRVAGTTYGYGDEAPAPAAAASGSARGAAAAEGSLGTMLVDAGGLTLYAFMTDTAGVPTCVDACAEAWPPALVDGEPAVDGVDASLVSTVEHPAGGTQLVVAGHPLYTFAGDAAPGDVNGHGSGDLWFAVAPDGTPIP